MWLILILVMLIGSVFLFSDRDGLNAAMEEDVVLRARAAGIVAPRRPEFRTIPLQLWERLGERLRVLVEDQLVFDDELSDMDPKLDDPFEDLQISGRNRTVLLDRVLARSDQAVILTVQDEPNLVIKYQANCFDIGRLHPLVRDYIFLREAAELGVSPAVHFLSPAGKFRDVPSIKTRFVMSRREQTECAEKPSSALRFMVMDRISETIHDRIAYYAERGSQAPPIEVIDAMIGTMEGIRKLHAHGIVHGDVHNGNIAFFDSNGTRTIGLIDFGHSFFLDEVEGTTLLPFWPSVPTHCLLSHWNIQGYRFSLRDDVFKALMAGAYFLNGPQWAMHCTALESNFRAMVNWKESGALFTVPGISNQLSQLSGDTRTAVEAHLDTALKLARSVESVDGVPPYDDILSALWAARTLVQH